MIDGGPIIFASAIRASSTGTEMNRLITFVITAVLSCGIALIRAQTAREWPTYPIKQAPAELQPAIQRADLVVAEIQNTTSIELARALSSGGPGEAIRVCHLSATALIYRLHRDEGIDAGRTAARLRIPSNAPKPWAAPIVKKYADAKAAGLDGFAVDLGDKVGVLRPVLHRATCSPCHGLDEQLDPQVRQELKDRYVVDRATDFKVGDLRGWIWVELPKEKMERK
jgi:uncharacterized protein DUF3365